MQLWKSISVYDAYVVTCQQTCCEFETTTIDAELHVEVSLFSRSSPIGLVFYLNNCAAFDDFQIKIVDPQLMKRCFFISRLAIVGMEGKLIVYDLDVMVTDGNGKEVSGERLKMKNKDVWNICWADVGGTW